MPSKHQLEIPVSSITVGERIRTDFSHVPALAESIAEDGLLHPIVVTSDHVLIAGESRLRAFRDVLKRETIPAIYYDAIDEAHRVKLEATENLRRKDFDWKETVLAIDKVHRLMSLQQALKGESWGTRETARLLNRKAHSNVHYATMIAERIRANDSDILKCTSFTDAIRRLVERKENEATKLLVAKSIPKDGGLSALTAELGSLKPGVVPSQNKTPGADPFITTFTPGIVDPNFDDDEAPAVTEVVIPVSRMLLREPDMNRLDTLIGLGSESVDHIVTDPPYGIDMANLQQANVGMDVSNTAAEHGVEDNLSLLDAFLTQASFVLRDKGFLVIWCDPMHWRWLIDLGAQRGLRPQRWPLVWNKTHPCQNGAAGQNFTKTIEFAAVFRKGNATLVSQQPSCVWTGANDVEAKMLGHPFAKPFALWKWVYKAVAMPGQTILDPFAGRGSATIAAIQSGYSPIAIETNEDHYNHLILNVQNTYRAVNPGVKFS